MGEFGFDTSKTERNKNPRIGGYMITPKNAERKNAFKKAKEKRIKEEKELVHRELHPLFQKTDEELRAYGDKVTKEAKEHRRKSQNMAAGITPAETEGDSEDGSDGSEEVIPVYGSVKKGDSKFSRGRIQERRHTEDGVTRVLIRWQGR